MTAISREATVILWAREYATLRSKLNHVNSRGRARCTDDAGRLFDALAEAEMQSASWDTQQDGP
jgi:hypothetical protein